MNTVSNQRATVTSVLGTLGGGGLLPLPHSIFHTAARVNFQKNRLCHSHALNLSGTSCKL